MGYPHLGRCLLLQRPEISEKRAQGAAVGETTPSKGSCMPILPGSEAAGTAGRQGSVHCGKDLRHHPRYRRKSLEGFIWVGVSLKEHSQTTVEKESRIRVV